MRWSNAMDEDEAVQPFPSPVISFNIATSRVRGRLEGAAPSSYARAEDVKRPLSARLSVVYRGGSC